MPHSADWTIPQGWEAYTAQDHGVWKTLYERQTKLLVGRACDAFVEGMRALPIGADAIPDFRRLSDVLMQRTGWQVVAVPGLVPDEVFFDHLANRRFPSGNFIRRPHELDYLEEPDVFHDVFGHAAADEPGDRRTTSRFTASAALRAQRLGVLDKLSRVYWYTVEFGLVQQGTGCASTARASRRRPRRACLQRSTTRRRTVCASTSKTRDAHALPHRRLPGHFVLGDMDELLALAHIDFAPLYERVIGAPEYLPGDVLASDRVVSPWHRRLPRRQARRVRIMTRTTSPGAARLSPARQGNLGRAVAAEFAARRGPRALSTATSSRCAVPSATMCRSAWQGRRRPARRGAGRPRSTVVALLRPRRCRVQPRRRLSHGQGGPRDERGDLGLPRGLNVRIVAAHRAEPRCLTSPTAGKDRQRRRVRRAARRSGDGRLRRGQGIGDAPTESMSAELKERGINVNCVLPTIIDTPENRAAMPDADPRAGSPRPTWPARSPSLRSDDARAIHGAALPVAG